MSTNTPTQDGQLELNLNPPLANLPQLWTPDDIFNTCDESIIRHFKEDARVERKVGGISQKALAEYCSMWANTSPAGGVTFLGVDDSGNLIGCKSIEQSHLNDLEAVRVLCPDARLEFKRVAVTNRRGKPDYILVMRTYYRDDKLVETLRIPSF